jgi:hydroxymethylglutaryl-CoA lyase
MNLPESVIIIECFLRDGLQHEEHFVKTEAKKFFAEAFMDSGIKEMEITSFANPKYAPQFRDSEDLLRSVNRKSGVILDGLTVSEGAVRRAIKAFRDGWGPDSLAAMISTSETHTRMITGMNHIDAFAKVGEWAQTARQEGMSFIGCVGTFLGCPLEGPIPIQKAFEFTQRFIDLGCQVVMYGDTTGEGTPERVFDFFSKILDQFPNTIHIAHFHDTRGFALANCWSALQAGVTHFCSSLGGIGGQPANIVDGVPIGGNEIKYAPSPITGNVCTEDLVVMFEEMGVSTGIDVEKLLKLGKLAERVLGRRLHSKCVVTGRLSKGIKKPKVE